MKTPSTPSLAKPHHLDPLLKASGGAADLVAAGRAGAFVGVDPAGCFAHFRSLAEGVSLEGLAPFRGVPLVMLDNVKRALVVAEPGFAVAAAKLRDPPLREVYELPSLVLGLQFAAGRVPATALSRGEVGALLAEQTPWRRLMLDYLDVVSDPLLDLVPRERVAAIREGTGPLDRAEDFVAIAGVFQEFAPKLQGQHPFSPAQLARLGEVGATLLQQMRPGNAARAEKVRGPEATLCDQFGALVSQRYEMLLELATLGLGRAKVEAEVPALFAVVRAPKGDKVEAKKEEAKKDAKPADPVVAPKTPTAAPTRPSAPPPA